MPPLHDGSRDAALRIVDGRLELFATCPQSKDSHPAGTVKTVTKAGVAVTANDEDVIVQKIWVDGRYRKPGDALSH